METRENPEQKVIQRTKNKEIVEIEGHLYLRQINPGVIIMPYTLNEDGTPNEIGIMSEILFQRPVGISKTLITGTPKDSDLNIFQTAVRELKEESGFNVEDIKKWKFLGALYTSKMVLNSNPCFAVDITGLVAEDMEPAESQKEKDSKFELVTIDEALNLEDSLISTLFIKTFKDLFNTIKIEDDGEPS